MSEPEAEMEADITRLPPGRHGLSREFVAHSQRERLLNGVVEAVATRGYEATTVAQIVAAAGVSRRAFYEHFGDKEECFAVAYGQILAHLCAEVDVVADPAEPWQDRVRAQLSVLLGLFAADPNLARFCLLGPPAVGGEVAVRHREAMQRFAALLRPEPSDRPARGSRPDARERALVGGIVTLVIHRLEAGEADLLPQLLPDLCELVFTPYLGRDEARQLARQLPAGASPASADRSQRAAKSA